MPTAKDYEAIVGSLSEPSKMPGYGYGLPALKSCNQGRLLNKVPGTACHDCYATKGRYLFPNVVRAHTKRLRSLTNPSWPRVMSELIKIKCKKVKYFRWHDSGDLVSVDHLNKIVDVAKRCPDIQFWLPTQEHRLVFSYIGTHGSFPANLTVRLSTPKIDERPISTPLCTSTIHKDRGSFGHICPSSQQGNHCGDCRACWDGGVKNVSYKHH